MANSPGLIPFVTMQVPSEHLTWTVAAYLETLLPSLAYFVFPVETNVVLKVNEVLGVGAHYKFSWDIAAARTPLEFTHALFGSVELKL